MLTIRLQRRGRKGNAQFRVIVQEHQYSPTSGKVVKYLGSFNPHTKETILNKEEAQKYLDNGAQPSDRAILILKKEGVKLPKWVEEPLKKSKKLKDPEKLRKNMPAEPKAAEAPAEAVAAEEAPAEAAADAPEEESPAKEPETKEAPEEPAQEPAEDKPEESKEEAPAAEEAKAEPVEEAPKPDAEAPKE